MSCIHQISQAKHASCSSPQSRFQKERKISVSNLITFRLQSYRPISYCRKNKAGNSQESLKQIPFLRGFDTTTTSVALLISAQHSMICSSSKGSTLGCIMFSTDPKLIINDTHSRYQWLKTEPLQLHMQAENATSPKVLKQYSEGQHRNLKSYTSKYKVLNISFVIAIELDKPK